MALRLADILVYGEFRNTAPWSTHGYILLDGAECPIVLDITGNCAPDLHGKAFRFAPRSGGSMQEVLDSIIWADADDLGDPSALPYDTGAPAANAPAKSAGEEAGQESSPRESAPNSASKESLPRESAKTEEYEDENEVEKVEGAEEAENEPTTDRTAADADQPSDAPAADADIFSGPRLPPSLPKNFGIHQIGVMGDATASRWVRALPCSVDEYLRRCDLGEKPPTQWKPSLYLEWYSQNGRVVIELEDPIIEVEVAKDQWAPLPPAAPCPQGDPDEPPTDADGNEIPILPEITLIRDGRVQHIDPEVPLEEQLPTDASSENPAADLQRHLDEQTRALERSLRGAAPRDDDDDMAEMELLDDLMDGHTEVAPATLFSDRRTLPRPEDVTEEQAAALLKTLLMELALYGIAFSPCEHSTARQLYRILANDILFDGRVYRELRGTGWVTGYLAAEYCPLCEAESDRQYGLLADPEPKGPAEEQPK